MTTSHSSKANRRAARPHERSRRGAEVEALAARYLAASGMIILERNVRRGRGEIDLIARDDEHIVFVEVRSRRSGGTFDPSVLSREKMKRLADAAEVWLAESGRPDALCRFDILAVRVGADGYRFRHVRAAFVVED